MTPFTAISLHYTALQVLRVVHRRTARRGTQGRDERAGDAHLHHAVLPQVRPEDHHALHLREPLPEAEQEIHVHRLEGGQPLRPAGHAVVPQIRAEKAQLRE